LTERRFGIILGREVTDMLCRHFLRFCVLFLALWCLGAAVRAADCDQPKRPVPAQTSTWYCFRDSDTVIVFVHGILSDNVGAWTNPSTTPPAFWPEIVLQDKANFGEPAIFLAAYPTGINAGEYDIDSAARAALDSLTISIEGRGKRVIDFKNIVFVAHSLGGIVSRRLVLMDTEDFGRKQLAFVLIASPSRGTDFNYYFKLLAQIVTVQNKLNVQMSFRNEYVEGLDSQFREFLRSHQATVIGAELFEALPLGQSPDLNGLLGSILRTGIDDIILGRKVASRPVVSIQESYGKYWEKKDAVIPGTDHISIAKPTSIDAPSHRALAAFFANFARPMFESAQATCPSLDEVGIRFNVKKYKNRKWPVLSFLRVSDDDDEGGEFEPEIPQASNGRFSLALNDRLPCPGKEMRAEMAVMGWQGQTGNSFAVTADEQDAVSQYQMSLCFKRSTDADKDKASASFDCKSPEKGQCKLNSSDAHSLAEACEVRDAGMTQPMGPSLAKTDTAMMAMAANDKATKKAVYWITPSLASIVQQPQEKRISYTEFTVRANDLPKQAGNADRFSAAVVVNETPVYFDGIDPDKLRRRISGRDSVSFQFGLDSLNFNGANFGYEQIEVKFNFYDGNRLVHTAYSRRPYAANRNYAESFNDVMKRLTYDSGGIFSWTGAFRPGGTGQDRYAILLQSAKSDPDLRAAIDKMEAGRNGLQGLGLSFDGKVVEGRLAAPRPTNTAVGLTLVLKLESGRTQGAFPLATAENLCRFLMRKRKKLLEVGAMTLDAVIYDYDPALYSNGRDIGRFRRTCQSFTSEAKR
jgi:Putative serine esterase (DUF676)